MFDRTAAISKREDLNDMSQRLMDEYEADTIIIGLAEELYKCKTEDEVKALRSNTIYNRYCMLAIKQDSNLLVRPGRGYKWGKLNAEVEAMAVAGGWQKPSKDEEEA